MLLTTLRLKEGEEQELTALLMTHPKAYVRERACALLKIHRGMSQKAVAKSGLLLSRREHTVGDWVSRFMKQGISSLEDAPRSGRKASFFPLNKGGSARKATVGGKKKPYDL
jgi:hypothetical protein